MATATKNTADPRPTGKQTREIDRRRLQDGSVNWSPSGELPNVVEQEAGMVPLKAINQITYGQQKVAVPGSLFLPATAADRAELLLGEFPAAEEPTTAELALFSTENTDFA